MKHARLEDMVKGWFVGNFDPSLAKTNDCEVAVKHYRAGDHEDTHHHRVATEITVIVSGEVEMLGRTFGAGDIVVIEPGEATSFTALTDATNVVVKLPGANNDKFMGEMPNMG